VLELQYLAAHFDEGFYGSAPGIYKLMYHHEAFSSCIGVREHSYSQMFVFAYRHREFNHEVDK
jgi:hypothetical protein